MHFDDLTPALLEEALPELRPIRFIGAGGQKRVYACNYQGQVYALKVHFIGKKAADESSPAATITDPGVDTAIARAKRAVEILRRCSGGSLARVGPVDVTVFEVQDVQLMYYLEEFIDGVDLKTDLAKNGPWTPAEIRRVGLALIEAIKELWECDAVHRDIKPANIIRRTADGSFVLIDIDLALDLHGDSLTVPGGIAGTKQYLSPEQLEVESKRSLDFRSDLFNVGVVMYELATGENPFWKPGTSSATGMSRIREFNPPSPKDRDPKFPSDLSDFIMRLLAKRPHLRFRSCDSAREALEKVDIEVVSE
jgi:serine/threonine protein kinase